MGVGFAVRQQWCEHRAFEASCTGAVSRMRVAIILQRDPAHACRFRRALAVVRASERPDHAFEDSRTSVVSQVRVPMIFQRVPGYACRFRRALAVVQAPERLYRTVSLRKAELARYFH